MPLSLKTARRLSNLTLEELAEKCGVDPSLLSKIELGKVRNPSHDSVVRICRALGVDPEELFPVLEYVPTPAEEQSA